MKMKIILVLLILWASQAVMGQNKPSANFTNPLFAGDYPDPSILRDGEDYYMVHSSFLYYPGLLIWHSTDLMQWEPVANALYQFVGSVWAPDLVKYKDKYYIYFPADNTNYVVWANDIAGPWSDPVKLDVSMIDPGHVADEQGNRFLYFSSGSYVPLTPDGLSLAGEVQHVYDGWEIPRDWTIECFCMEGPKLVKRGDYYYLTVAEGGTAGPATGHMVISARSKSPLGPWENSPYNPILRATSTRDKWWSVGHGTVFDDVEGNWYILFHAYEKDFYNMGRQTMLAPLEWTPDGWFKIPEAVDIAETIPLPVKEKMQQKTFILSDDFKGEELKPHWKFFGAFEENRIEHTGEDLIVAGKGNAVATCSPMLCIPSDHSYIAEVELEIEKDAIGGLVLFYNERAFSGILADKNNVLANLRGWQFITEPEAIDRHVYLRVINRNNTVDMYYRVDGETWHKIENSFEASAYHHNVLSGFMSLRIGLCAMGEGQVVFKNFTYQSLNE